MRQRKFYSLSAKIINGDEIMMETTAEDIIGKIQDTYAEILSLYRDVPLSNLLDSSLPNGWSVKDVLAHLAAWEARCASLLDEAHASDTPLKAMPDIEALNREFYEERRTWSWEEVESEFRAAHRNLLDAIQGLPRERLDDPFIRQSIAEETWEHYQEHLPDLRRWHEQAVNDR